MSTENPATNASTAISSAPAPVVIALPPSSTYGSCGAYPGYEPLGGTSMAAPHVAGVAPLPSGLGLPRDRVVECILSTAYDPVTGARGASDPVYGYEIVDAEAAAAGVPGLDLDRMSVSSLSSGGQTKRQEESGMKKLRVVLLTGAAASALVVAAPAPAHACSVDGPVNLCILEEPCSIAEDLKPEKLGCYD